MPARNTGSSSATGVSFPLLPTCTIDVAQRRGLALRRELVGDAPVRVVAGLAEPRVPAVLVDLDDHPVDLEVELGAALAVALAVGEGFLGVGRQLHLVEVDARAARGEPRQHLVLRVGDGHALHPRHLIEERADAGRVQPLRLLALHQPGASVSRVDQGALARLGQPRVVGVERGRAASRARRGSPARRLSRRGAARERRPPPGPDA